MADKIAYKKAKQRTQSVEYGVTEIFSVGSRVKANLDPVQHFVMHGLEERLHVIFEKKRAGGNKTLA